jgi:hypothetical protein
MKFVLDQIRNISTPVVIAGDLNTMPHDAAPITIKHELKTHLTNYRFWLRQALYQMAPFPGLNFLVAALNSLKNYHDPTVTNIPVLAANHSKPLFDGVHEFRFADGTTFAWAGEDGTLSQTNQRAWKGFSPTYSFPRTYHGLVGEYKLDWILVKQPKPAAPFSDQNPLFLPYSGRTLWHLNWALGDQISDHCPITLDFPLR